MGLLNLLFKKKIPILNQEDVKELREIERKAYMEEAKKIMEKRGQQLAKNELEVKIAEKY